MAVKRTCDICDLEKVEAVAEYNLEPHDSREGNSMFPMYRGNDKRAVQVFGAMPNDNDPLNSCEMRYTIYRRSGRQLDKTPDLCQRHFYRFVLRCIYREASDEVINTMVDMAMQDEPFTVNMVTDPGLPNV